MCYNVLVDSISEGLTKSLDVAASFFALLDTVNRRESQNQSLRYFVGGGVQQPYTSGLTNKINVDYDMYE